MSSPALIIVNGLPGSGKSTLAGALADRLNLPVFTKDSFKELLSDVTGIVNLEYSRLFGKASYLILYSIAKELLRVNQSLLIEGNFTQGPETFEFVKFMSQRKYKVVELLCYAKGQLLIDRFSARTRHPIHHVLPPSEFESMLRQEKIPSLGIGPTLELDLSDFSTISYDHIAAQVATLLGSAAADAYQGNALCCSNRSRSSTGDAAVS